MDRHRLDNEEVPQRKTKVLDYHEKSDYHEKWGYHEMSNCHEKLDCQETLDGRRLDLEPKARKGVRVSGAVAARHRCKGSQSIAIVVSTF